jgi:O-antigen/teichoic acid export membrane protein
MGKPAPSMSTKRLVARNVLWNWAGTFITMAAGFLVAPFLIHELGNTIYGLWIQIASLTNFFGFLDLGIRGAVGRNIAFLRAKDDLRGVNGVLNTSLVLLFVLGVVGMLGILVYRLFFFDLFLVPTDLRDKVQWTLLIIAVNLGLVLVFNAFDATLWGFQRFDIINAVDIPATLLRTGLVFYFIGEGRGLVTLALLTLALTCYCGLLKMWFSFRVEPGLRLNFDFASRVAGRQLFGYGIWYFLLSLSRLVNTQIWPQIVSNRLGSGAVTPLSMSIILIRAASAIMVAATGVLMPLATAFHAQKERESQRTLFVEGSKYCTALSFLFLGGFWFLGQPFLALWLSHIPEAKNWFVFLVVLALGEVLPMTQMVTWNILLGMARHPLLAILSLIENLIAIPASILLLNHQQMVLSVISFFEEQLHVSMPGLSSQAGLVGFCVAFAVPAVVCRGILPAMFGCQLLGVSLPRYLAAVLLPTTMIWLPSVLGLALLNAWHAPVTWPQLVFNGSVFFGVYLTLVCQFVIGWDQLFRFFRSRPDPGLVGNSV